MFGLYAWPRSDKTSRVNTPTASGANTPAITRSNSVSSTHKQTEQTKSPNKKYHSLNKDSLATVFAAKWAGEGFQS